MEPFIWAREAAENGFLLSAVVGDADEVFVAISIQDYWINYAFI